MGHEITEPVEAARLEAAPRRIKLQKQNKITHRVRTLEQQLEPKNFFSFDLYTTDQRYGRVLNNYHYVTVDKQHDDSDYLTTCDSDFAGIVNVHSSTL